MKPTTKFIKDIYITYYGFFYNKFPVLNIKCRKCSDVLYDDVNNIRKTLYSSVSLCKKCYFYGSEKIIMDLFHM